MKREEVNELIEQGITELNEALASGKSDRLHKFMEVMSRFPRYSFNNCLLIEMQFPAARMVQGFQAWKKLGRSVKKGSKGIGIIAPMSYRAKEDEASDAKSTDERVIRGFKVVHVFDVSQTEGDDLPEFATVSGNPGDLIEATEHYIQSQGIELAYEDLPEGCNGLSKHGRIIIRLELEPAERMLTLVHEVAHEILHWDEQRRKETTKTIRETEAEAVAHVVGQALGLDCLEHSVDYIQLYKGDVEVLAKSLDHIQKTSAQVLEGIEQQHVQLSSAQVAV